MLVGAGPGSPGLLTVRAVECLQAADLVLYDRLVPTRLLDFARTGSKCVCIDDLPGRHPGRAPHIHAAMIDAARQGLRVVRLKGGDPFLFGRGAEEAQALHAAGLEYEVVPGVTAALGATAFAGIPVTHRRLASAVALITGHEQPGKIDGALDWDALARFPGTLVFYMGVARLPEIAQTLIAAGKSADTPAAAIHWGTTNRQRTVEADLATLPAAAEEVALGAPSLVVVGPVVRMRSELAWFETRPLLGKTVLVTRPREQAGSLVRKLEDCGATVMSAPAVEIRDLVDFTRLDDAIKRLDNFDWIVFTSSNGVRALVLRLLQVGRDLRAFGPLRIAAIGPATAQALREIHLEPDLVPERFQSEDLAAALVEFVRGRRVLLARADRGREVLLEELSKVATVEQVAVYCQVDAAELDPVVAAALDEGGIDYMTLTSSNIARALLRQFGPRARQRCRDGLLGLVTSDAVREFDLPVAAEAAEATIDGVLKALVAVAVDKK
jgi:uroporphyrinogen III methyltransferase/synthase